MAVPKKQRAVQLVGPDELVLNDSKEVFTPGPHQIMCKVEAAGLCFSDLKLLKQFSSHVRKGPIVSGIDTEVLDEIPSYVPGYIPTVPGHEAVVRVCEVGPEVEGFASGERCLVQANYRWLQTAGANGAFGYNIEGALQEYVLIDERVITSPEGDSMLLPVPEGRSAAAIALVEPWACVEDAYASSERCSLKSGGMMLVVSDEKIDVEAFAKFLANYGRPERITWVSKGKASKKLGVPVTKRADLSKVKDGSFDDVIYYGSNPDTAENLFAKLAKGGLLNITLCGGRLGRAVTVPFGRIHYSGIRVVGTVGSDPSASMEYIPPSGEIRNDNRVGIVGAGGPMGMMHTVRNICQGVQGISLYPSDVSPDRLEVLEKVAAPIAHRNHVPFKPFNPKERGPDVQLDYVAIMVPVPDLVAQSARNAAEGAIINIFAGIPVDVSGEADLDGCIERRVYFMGTSGSLIRDMHMVLEKVKEGKLDTGISVAAVCGLEGAIEGIRAIENRLIPGKIIVYPSCEGLDLVPLSDMGRILPQVAERLADGVWTLEAENALLGSYKA